MELGLGKEVVRVRVRARARARARVRARARARARVGVWVGVRVAGLLGRLLLQPCVELPAVGMHPGRELLLALAPLLLGALPGRRPCTLRVGPRLRRPRTLGLLLRVRVGIRIKVKSRVEGRVEGRVRLRGRGRGRGQG